MPWKTDKPAGSTLRQNLLLLVAVFVLSGCASKPWTDPLQEAEVDDVAHQVDAFVARDAVCGATLEGDLVLFYQTPVTKKALSGYLRFSMPASYNFVMTNPLGQPVLAIVGDQRSFQAINTMEKKFMAGSLRSFGLRNKVPDYLLNGNWGSWLTGRNLLGGQAITEIRNDKEARGVWLTFQNTAQGGVSHLLLDRDQGVVLTRILDDEKGRTLARISYDNWISMGECKQPLDINVAGLEYGTEVHLTLSNVLLTDKKRSYHLQPPADYLRQYMP